MLFAVCDVPVESEAKRGVKPIGFSGASAEFE